MSSKRYRNYTKENLVAAVNAVKNGMPTATASKRFHVPRITLHYKVNGKYALDCRSGPSTVLTSEEENRLVKWMLEVGEMGFPVTKEQLLDSVAMLVQKLKRDNPFTDGRPGRHWYEGFLSRHKEVSLRLSQNLTKCRAAISEKAVRDWFQEIESYFLRTENFFYLGSDPKRIFNADETAFFLHPKGSKVLVKKGCKTVYNRINGDEKECITTLVVANAAGQLAPPMTVFAYERVPKHIIMNMPDRWGIGKSENGWMTADTFFEYVANIFYPWLVRNSISFPVLLYVDGHKSHLTLNLSNFCSEKQIILVSLLPNATHILQPLDVGVFHPLKNAWRKAVHNYRVKTKQHPKRETFARLLDEVLNSTFENVDTIKNAFITCGLCPFNPNAINFKKLLTVGCTDTNENEKSDPLTEKKIETGNNANNVLSHLKYIESKIDQHTLTQFYELRQGNHVDIDEKDASLFDLWSQIYAEVEASGNNSDSNNNSFHCTTIPENEVGDQLILEGEWIEELLRENDNTNKSKENLEEIHVETDENGLVERSNGEDIDERILQTETTENTEESSNNEDVPVEKECETSIEEHSTEDISAGTSTAQCSQHENNTENENNRAKKAEEGEEIVPSPFKSTLFWPDRDLTKKKNKKTKEKIPSVASSEDWKAFYQKKEDAKKKIEEEKIIRKRKREENKAMKEGEKLRKLHNKNRNKEQTHEKNKVDEVKKSLFAKEKDEEYNFDKNSLKVEDYVVVDYEDIKYPGIITALKKTGATVNVMTESGRSRWKWPTVKDEIFYKTDSIIEKIGKPKQINNRGIYSVPEMDKYNKFLYE